MLHTTGDNAFQIVQKLVTKEATTGLQKLWEKGKLELSIEAIIIKPVYRELFSQEIIDICTKKLKKIGYKFDK